MHCPSCGHEETKVNDSRLAAEVGCVSADHLDDIVHEAQAIVDAALAG